MVSITTIADGIVYGCDTETYSIPTLDVYGLKSIQVYSNLDSHYFTASNYMTDDESIRYEICSKFFGWLETLSGKITLAFFNLDFDFSQMVKWLVTQSGYEYSEEDSNRWKKERSWSLLESEKIYKVTLNIHRGLTVVMVDIANFLTSTTLDKASREWVGEHKVPIAVKVFPKWQPSPIERKYAMKDAELTYKLFRSLQKNEVVEGLRYVTIAGRTIGHFKEYLKKTYGCSFNQFCYLTDDKELVRQYNLEWETVLRPSNRGGCCMAFHKGLFHNCIHIDATSHYPSRMSEDYIPMGNVLYEPPEGRYTTIVYPSGYLKLKEGKLPYIQWNSKGKCILYSWLKEYDAGEYVEDCCLNGSHAFWSDEWEIIKECYDFYDVTITKTVYVRMTENVQLKSYIRMLFEGKKNNVGTKRYYYKILMNSLYGKFLSRPDGKKITYEHGERETVEENDRSMFYLPLGSWIAMRGRVILFQLMLKLDPSHVLYCDTDSIIYNGPVDPTTDIGKELGQWTKEAQGIDVWIVGPKTYQEVRDGKTITKCAGLNDDVRAEIGFTELRENDMYLVKRAVRDKESWAKNVKIQPYVINTRASILR